MTREVVISISGVRFSESDQEDTEMITMGDYFMKNGKHYIVYDEIAGDNGEIIKNTIKIMPDSMDILKRGCISSHMVFEKNKKNLACYITSVGELMVGIHTRNISLEEEENLLKVNVEYSLDINYEHVSDCSIIVSVRPKGSDISLGKSD